MMRYFLVTHEAQRPGRVESDTFSCSVAHDAAIFPLNLRCSCMYYHMKIQYIDVDLEGVVVVWGWYAVQGQAFPIDDSARISVVTVIYRCNSPIASGLPTNG